ncbi:MAG: hypothetical protein MK312_10890, partial [Roseibacillus sp.]|nr:hypothetical protein [Roseibacillus sp.]
DGKPLLYNSMIVSGVGLTDGDRHSHNDLPIILAGHAGGQFRTGRHVDLKGDVPMNNLYLRMLQEIGAPAGALGDSTGVLSQV